MLGVTLIGVDGSRWNLRNGPVQLTTAGLGGLGMRTPKYQTIETARGHGQRTTSWKFAADEAALPLKWNPLYAHDIEGLQRDFWRAIFSSDHTKQCQIVVTDREGSERYLTVRFGDDGSMAYALDPYTWQEPFRLKFIADDPWWYGEVLTVPFMVGLSDAANFFGGGSASDPSGVAPPFYLAAGRGADSTQVRNPGDADVWATWTVTAQALGVSAFRFGVGGHFVGSDGIPMAPGDVLEIATSPVDQVALLNGVNKTRALDEIDWASIPPGGFQDVSIDVTGSALVEVTFNPRYARAF